MKKVDFEHLNKKDLLTLPERKPYVSTAMVYDKLLIIPTRIKHESGFARIAIIGFVGDMAEITACPDDICWDFTKAPKGDLAMRTDCYYPSGILKMWGHRIEFQVGEAFSSTDIKVLEKQSN
jgi:hypothetical protein